GKNTISRSTTHQSYFLARFSHQIRNSCTILVPSLTTAIAQHSLFSTFEKYRQNTKSTTKLRQKTI
ncbi:TPA: hypothetical protein ACN96K_003699, partial [Vibrio parahaemolyticus]